MSSFLARNGANIVESAQHTTDPTGGTFVMRTEFELIGSEPPGLGDAFERDVASAFGMQWRLSGKEPKRVAILASRSEHCVLDLLWRWRRNELTVDVTTVISNHPDLAEDVRAFGLPFEHVPVLRDHKPEAEEQMLSQLAGRVDLVVLARYMQILSADFLDRLGAPIINIHHSFLPAFVGAEPYRRAHERGVKIIGATAHYVTEELDEGPIIEQDVERVSHRCTLEELERIGADIERLVLARAVKWHVEDRVAVHENKTFVFA